MKAAVFYETGGPEVLRYEEVPEPVCTPDGVVIEVAVISIEGADTLTRAGKASWLPTGQALPKPFIVGYQSAGTVREVGAQVKNLRIGDRVVAFAPSGAYAERVAALALTTWVLPSGTDFFQAACVPVAFGTAHEALFALGQLRRGQTVLVHAGAGGVGLAAIQLAKAAGAVVLTTASSDAKLARLREFGATYGINYKTSSFADAVTKAIGPDGVDLVIDPVGGKTLQESVTCLKYRGRIVSIGVSGRDDVPFNPVALWGRNGTLIGLGMPTSLQYEYDRAYGVIAECVQRVASGELSVIIDKKFVLSDAAKAHQYIEERTAFGRVVLVPAGRNPSP